MQSTKYENKMAVVSLRRAGVNEKIKILADIVKKLLAAGVSEDELAAALIALGVQVALIRKPEPEACKFIGDLGAVSLLAWREKQVSSSKH